MSTTSDNLTRSICQERVRMERDEFQMRLIEEVPTKKKKKGNTCQTRTQDRHQEEIARSYEKS